MPETRKAAKAIGLTIPPSALARAAPTVLAAGNTAVDPPLGEDRRPPGIIVELSAGTVWDRR